jgi:hypothetical protein
LYIAEHCPGKTGKTIWTLCGIERGSSCDRDQRSS